MDADKETAGRGSSSEAFHRVLGEYLGRFERDGSAAFEDFRATHPQFASRLGRQLEWLAEHLARGRAGLPERIGPHRVIQRLGRGGMGEVFLAEQTTPFRRAIAIKVVRSAAAKGRSSERFAAEIQALASLNHDGIAKVFEAGNDDGWPYFTMEYVPGKPITDFCADERLDLPARLRLFVSVCRAVEHAHRHGILHRDLKPSNILVCGPRTEPIAKIIDFGLAKLLQHPTEQGPHTVTGQIVGTPDYMSPEQVDESTARVVDTRADVYSLGVVLYELLTGLLPLSLWQVRGHDVLEVQRAIREREPSSPSVRVEEGVADSETSPAAGGGLSLHRLSRLLAGDIDAIALKALAKDRERRYGSAAALADDILRHLRHEPVAAREPTRWYVTSKFVRRHRGAVAFAATIAVLSFASLITINVLTRASIRNLERGELFGLVHYLQELRDRDGEPPAARPQNLAALEGWLTEFDTLLAQRDRMRSFLAAPPADSGAGGNAAWAASEVAHRTLRAALDQALRTMAAMARPAAERDKMIDRIEWSRRVVAETVTGKSQEWQRVQAELREDPRFASFELAPQPGLVPVGRDPASGLQEFALVLPRCAVPRRVEGRLAVEHDTCPIFVLLPGGDVTVGSQGIDANAPRFDPGRRAFEPELEDVVVAPFFASKYELTNGQWRTVDPSDHGRIASPLNEASRPVVGVGLDSSLHVLGAWGMRLPTSDEWEYLARAGTDTPFASGADLASLATCANVHDAAIQPGEGKQGEGVAAPWSDGHAITAPVGTFAANAFGLFDVHGNASEVAVVEVDGVVQYELRGGSWHQGPASARITHRTAWDGSPRPSIGCRPVISVVR